MLFLECKVGELLGVANIWSNYFSPNQYSGQLGIFFSCQGFVQILSYALSVCFCFF